MSKKEILYYYQISIKERLDIEIEKAHLEQFQERHCGELFIIGKIFKNDEHVFDVCFKTVNGIEKYGKIDIIWLNNSKYRAYTNLWESFADEIMRKEELLDKYEYLDVNKYNKKLHHSKISLEIKENAPVALHLDCSIKNSNIDVQKLLSCSYVINSFTCHRR